MSTDAKDKSTSGNAASTANPPPTTTQQVAEAIEEDDEFEEFEPCRWDANDEDAEDCQQWQVCRAFLGSGLLIAPP